MTHTLSSEGGHLPVPRNSQTIQTAYGLLKLSEVCVGRVECEGGAYSEECLTEIYSGPEIPSAIHTA